MVPEGVRAEQLDTTRGTFAALIADPVRTGPADPHQPAPCVLLLPGWTGSKEDFLPSLVPIARSGRRAIAIDHRGQYETPGPDDLAAYTLEAFGADAVALADTCRATEPGTPWVHVVGHSFGGLAARAAVLTDPMAFTSITLVASGPGQIDGAKNAQLRVMAMAIPVLGLPAVYAAKRQLERSITPPPTAEVEEFLRARFCAGVPASLEAMTRHLVDAPDRVDQLAATGIPAHVVTGLDDDAWSLDAQADMAARLGAKYVVLDDAGHSPAIESPERLVTSLTVFWDDVEAGHERVGAQ